VHHCKYSLVLVQHSVETVAALIEPDMCCFVDPLQQSEHISMCNSDSQSIRAIRVTMSIVMNGSCVAERCYAEL
jgi:hypothetical protein